MISWGRDEMDILYMLIALKWDHPGGKKSKHLRVQMGPRLCGWEGWPESLIIPPRNPHCGLDQAAVINRCIWELSEYRVVLVFQIAEYQIQRLFSFKRRRFRLTLSRPNLPDNMSGGFGKLVNQNNDINWKKFSRCLDKWSWLSLGDEVGKVLLPCGRS